MFRALENAFIINNADRKLALKRQMNSVSMNKGETINVFFMRITYLRDQLSALGYEIENQELSLIALGRLPGNPFVQGISVRSKIPKLDHLRSDCLQEESRLMIKGKHKTLDEDVQVLNTNAHKKGKNKNNKRKRNFHGKGQSKQKKDLSKIQCFRCDLYGHYAINCPDRSKPQASFAKSEKSNEGNEYEKYVFYSTLSSQISTKRNTWIVDSRSSRHITGYQDNLESMQIETDEVTIGDDFAHSVKGIGTCTIKLKSGNSIQLSGVLYVPGIKRNLISISTLEDDGFRITFMGRKVLAWPKIQPLKGL